MAKNTRTIGLHKLVEGFLFSLKAEGRTTRTCEYYSKPLHHFLTYAAENNWLDDPQEIDTQQIREFLSWAASRTYTFIAGNNAQQVRKAKPTSAWSYFRALRRLFNWAIEEGFIEASPLTKIHFKPPTAARVEPYSQEDLKRLIAICDLDIRTGARFTGLRNKAMLLLFLDSGLRRAEMARLKLGDVNLENRRSTVLGKGNKIGIVPFCSKTAKTIWHYLVERESRAKSENLWITEEGNAFSIDGIDSWFNRLKIRAGIPRPSDANQ